MTRRVLKRELEPGSWEPALTTTARQMTRRMSFALKVREQQA